MATTPTNENKGGTATSKAGQIEYCEGNINIVSYHENHKGAYP